MFLCVSFKNTSGKNVYEVYKKYILKNNTFFLSLLYSYVLHFLFTFSFFTYLHTNLFTYLFIVHL